MLVTQGLWVSSLCPLECVSCFSIRAMLSSPGWEVSWEVLHSLLPQSSLFSPFPTFCRPSQLGQQVCKYSPLKRLRPDGCKKMAVDPPHREVKRSNHNRNRLSSAWSLTCIFPTSTPILTDSQVDRSEGQLWTEHVPPKFTCWQYIAQVHTVVVSGDLALGRKATGDEMVRSPVTAQVAP